MTIPTLQKLLREGCVVLPGAHNGLVSRLVKKAGFNACYISGAAISASAGLPDIGLLSRDHMCRSIKEITTVSGLPCLADADTGFGGVEAMRYTVFDYHQNGASGLHIEDQAFPKRCGHLSGKTLISCEEMCEKVDRCVAASRDCSNGTFLICARTDARSVEGLDGAIARACQYVAAGAHMIFPEGLTSQEEFADFAKAMRMLEGGGPWLLANMTEFGQTPQLPVSFFESEGYNAVIYPVTSLRVATKPVEKMLIHLKTYGTVRDLEQSMFTREDLYKTLQYNPGNEWKYPSSY